MIDFFRLQPIHTGNTPRGKLFKPFPKKISKSVEKSNPQLSFVINSQHNLKFQKISKSPSTKIFFDHLKQNPQKQMPKTLRLSPRKDQLNLTNKSSTLFLEKSQDLKTKFISENIIRKKLRSVCYTRKQQAKIQLSKCMQSLYLKIQSDKISVQNPKIQTKQRQARPYARSLRESLY